MNYDQIIVHTKSYAQAQELCRRVRNQRLEDVHPAVEKDYNMDMFWVIGNDGSDKPAMYGFAGDVALACAQAGRPGAVMITSEQFYQLCAQNPARILRSKDNEIARLKRMIRQLMPLTGHGNCDVKFKRGDKKNLYFAALEMVK